MIQLSMVDPGSCAATVVELKNLAPSGITPSAKSKEKSQQIQTCAMHAERRVLTCPTIACHVADLRTSSKNGRRQNKEQKPTFVNRESLQKVFPNHSNPVRSYY